VASRETTVGETVCSREQMLRDWQLSRDRKLSVAPEDEEVSGEDKENAPENRTPRKNFHTATASSKSKTKPTKGKDGDEAALEDEARRERCAPDASLRCPCGALCVARMSTTGT
jgi:hypothetical protein